MDKSNGAYPIENCGYTAGGDYYDLAIYRQDGAFHAQWCCRRCRTQAATAPRREWNTAKQDAQDAIGAHHFEKHTPGLVSRAAFN
ncbi:hypothetical protein [Lacipirellula sp.]|uniref:hypothetical protein n=1 Tax=Lacipirellula sp. TaxID=2691419 RepID=UPI003D147270